jgi:hypothetical protein
MLLFDSATILVKSISNYRYRVLQKAYASFIRLDVSRQRAQHSPVDWMPAKTKSRAV